MKTTVLQPFGVRVTGMPLKDVDTFTVQRWRHLLADHGVVVLPEQDAGDRDFRDFLARFGDLTCTPGEAPMQGYPELNVISNVGRKTPPRSVFHVDTSYVRRPPAYTALRAVRIPRHGGETLFTDQYRAHDTLPDGVRRHLAGRTLRHVVTGIDPATLPAGAETEAEHPVLRKHPVSGRVSLYLSTPERCVSVSGLDDDEGRDLITMLYAHSTDERNVLRHRWSAGDVVMWDNGVVLHRADHTDVRGERVMHRGMVAA